MDFELIEELRNVLTGIEAFMTLTLKRVHLKKDAMNQKNAIVTSITEFLKKLNRISDCGIDSPKQEVNIELYEEEDVDEVGPMPAQQLKNPAKVGLLEKKRQQGLGRQTNTRYCVIKDNVMYYYKNRRDKKQTGAIVLDGYDVRPVTQVQMDRKKEYAFELIHPTKRYYKFVTEDQPALTAWIKALNITAINPEHVNDNEQEGEYNETDDDDDVFQQDIAGVCSRNSSINSEQRLSLSDRRPSSQTNIDTIDTGTVECCIYESIQEEEPIPPPPAYPPPPLPAHPKFDKRPSQSECFQAFASDLKLRLVKVDVPSVPKQGSQPNLETQSNIETSDISTKMTHDASTNGSNHDNLCEQLAPTKPPRNWHTGNDQDDKTLSTNTMMTSRKKTHVPVPSSKSCRRKHEQEVIGDERKTNVLGHS